MLALHSTGRRYLCARTCVSESELDSEQILFMNQVVHVHKWPHAAPTHELADKIVDPHPWLIHFGDLELQERIGQGSFSRVSLKGGSRGT